MTAVFVRIAADGSEYPVLRDRHHPVRHVHTINAFIYIDRLQWVCVIIQCCAIAIIQYDTCKNRGVLPERAYLLIGTATSITAVTSVRACY